MPSLEQRLHYLPHQFMFELEPFQSDQMTSDSMEATYNAVACSYYDSLALYGSASQDPKYDMIRSASECSMQQRHDVPPSLHSSASAPSVPSASSSTVGSPYSGPIHHVPAAMYMDHTSQYLGAPTILSDDVFPHAYETAHFDPNSTFGAEPKLSGPFVGECADLSVLVQRSPSDCPKAPALFQSPTLINLTPPTKHISPDRAQPREKGIPRAGSTVSTTTTASEDHPRLPSGNGIFKSPSKPASAYQRANTTVSSQECTQPRGAIAEASPAPSSALPMQQYGRNSQYFFFSQTSGSFMPPIEASYPVLISGNDSYLNASPYNTFPPPRPTQRYSPAPSPAPSAQSYHSFRQPVTVDNYVSQQGRRQSISSSRSASSPQASYSGDEDSKENRRCPYPDCGRYFKDMKAHLLTHEDVRPEKCPIPSCEYHKKGFARKYDKNRHTLTHYRGTMVCGFCPGSGSAAEKSFNRADVFKRHLTSVHAVEQTAPNSRKRSPSKTNINLSSYCQDATGKCSTCSATFTNAQDFYEHLDDCVLKVVQQEDPSETINAQRLAEVMNDADVATTFERNNIKQEEEEEVQFEEYDDDSDEEDEDEDEESNSNERFGKGVIKSSKVARHRPIIGGNITKKALKKGLTWSKGGGSIVGKSRKRRKFYPPSWGMATDKMNMKKRVLCVYDGPRRLLKDDMMMHNEYEVRMPLADGQNYVTDLDMETMNRADAFHNATAEEKGPWIQEEDFLQEFLN